MSNGSDTKRKWRARRRQEGRTKPRPMGSPEWLMMYALTGESASIKWYFTKD